MLGPLLTRTDYWVGAVISVVFISTQIAMFMSVKYSVKDNELGVRWLWKWHWYPIDKISSVKKTTGILATAGLSARRVSIKFSERKILKSSAPLEISPKDRDSFISDLLAINPDITVG